MASDDVNPSHSVSPFFLTMGDRTYRSDDGQNWLELPEPYSASRGQQRPLTVSIDGKSYTSEDGMNWTEVP